MNTTSTPRTTATPLLTRAAVAVAGLSAVGILAGCAAGATEATSTPTATSDATSEATTEATATAEATAAASDSTFVDGTYTADGSYTSPNGTESITVTVTIDDDIITAVEVVGHATSGNSKQFQTQFASGIAAEVVGKALDEVSVSRVAGSSLTSTGFNAAIDTIEAEAEA